MRASLATGRPRSGGNELLGYVAADGREVGFEEGQL